MSQQNDESAGEKEHDPSQKRLEDARKQGDIVKSTELLAAASYAGLLLAGIMAADALSIARQTGAVLIDQAPDIARLASGSARTVIAGAVGAMLVPVAMFFILPMVAVVLALVAQRAFVLTPENLLPKGSRISPLATAKKKFGPEGLFEFAKSFVKLVVVSVILAWFLMGHANSILATAQLDPTQGLLHMIGLIVQFLMIVLILTTAIGALDLIWQRHTHLQRNRMSRKEMLDEMKESEGDPHTKAQRRQRGQEIATNQMLTDVAKANVVIVNPTHYAVALRWSRGSRSAPVVVAKGVDEVARRIRERAAEHGVPVHSDPPTARALFATVDVGKPISREHYRAVAAAIRFAEAMRKRAKGRLQ